MTYFQVTPEGGKVEAHNRTLLRSNVLTYTFIFRSMRSRVLERLCAK